ncbi:MAG TPA: hypothetical protein VFV01_47870 [Spirillospora sp.]|nr:hypothetical protein [Spirillospora sp.]
MSDYAEQLRADVRRDDDDRPRSQQTTVGWSDVGGCRAYLGFVLNGEWTTDDPDTWRAIVGTALHDYFARLRAGEGREHEVRTLFGGIPGHADEVDDDSVTDFKFPTLAVAESWKRDADALLPKRQQVQGYAAGLVAAGRTIRTVRIMVCPVDGGFEDWWCHEEPYDEQVANDAVEKLREVQALLDEGLSPPRDKPFDWCMRFCEFFAACRGDQLPNSDEPITDPELAAQVRLYGELADEIRPTEKLRKKIGAEIKGLRGRAGEWRVGLTKPSGTKDVPDMAAIEADYAARGVPLPTKEVPTSAPSLMVRRVKD